MSNSRINAHVGTIRTIMLNLYENCLMEAVNETDVFDARGNVVIGKDLKVRHKKSQFEYTVDDVYEDPETNNMMLTLRLPEEPRIEPQHPEGMIVDTLVHNNHDLSLEDPPHSPNLDSDEDIVFVIDQKEFEKDYEVK